MGAHKNYLKIMCGGEGHKLLVGFYAEFSVTLFLIRGNSRRSLKNHNFPTPPCLSNSTTLFKKIMFFYVYEKIYYYVLYFIIINVYFRG
jgi:hypothetical protein